MATRLDGLTSYLKQSYQPSPLDSAMLQRSLRGTSTTLRRPQDAVSPTMFGTTPGGGEWTTSPGNQRFLPSPSPSPTPSIPNVGQFNTPGSLPTNPGPPDPPVSMGYLDVSGNTMDPPGTNIPWVDPSGTNLSAFNTGISFGPGGALQGGTNGPQGSVYGTDPRTGQPIYNVTGSPRPGFFDSRTGKVTEALGAGALNFFVPGLGLVTKAIFDAIRRGNDKRNTGTDLTSRNQPAPSAPPPPMGGGFSPSLPPGGSLLGYRPSEGGGTPHFDFTRGGYTTTVPGNPLYSTGGSLVPNTPVSNAGAELRFAQNSGTGNWVADQTTKDFLAAGGYKGTPNKAMPDSRNQFTPGSGFIGQIDQDTGLLQRVSGPTVKPFVATKQSGPALTTNPNSLAGYNAAIMQQPGYQAYMQRLAALKQGG